MITGIIPFFRAIRIFLLVSLLMCLCSPAQAKRNDVVIMNNGDHFTGEVKSLGNGLLYISTDYVADNIGLDWNQVRSVQSTGTYRIVLTNGQRYQGTIEKSSGEKATSGDFVIREATEVVPVPSADVAGPDPWSSV